jgi:hypothetical protein
MRHNCFEFTITGVLAQETEHKIDRVFTSAAFAGHDVKTLGLYFPKK